MKHPERVSDYLDHIVEAIDLVAIYLKDIHDLSDFQRDGRTRDTVVRTLEIIGEAANRIKATAP